MRSLQALSLACAAAGSLTLGAAARAQATATAPATSPKIVNGVGSHDRPTTVALLFGSPAGPDQAQLGCTGTLIGCQTVLTAAHCVEGERAKNVLVYLQHAGLFAVTRIQVHPQYASADADVAVLKLGQRVNGIAPTAFNTIVDPAQRTGTPGWIAGYGVTDGDGEDAGLKRAGKVVTAPCGSSSGGELSDRKYVCWRFDASVGPAGLDSNTCYGDSGGPLFLTLDGHEVVAGVTSGGLVDSCGPGDVGYDANVFAYRSFIQSQLGADSTATCGGLPPVGSPSTAVVGRDGGLGKGQEARYVFDLGAGARELRFVLNGEDNGALDVDLYVKRGTSVSTSQIDSKGTGKSDFAACGYGSPQAGKWAVLIRAAAGSGGFQLTGTAFAALLSADGGSGSGGGGNGNGAGNGGGTPSAASCQGACGGPSRDRSCWCDAECTANGDCCADFEPFCRGQSCRQSVCAADSYCCAVEWDADCDDEAAELCH
jgi:hypothetical protein